MPAVGVNTGVHINNCCRKIMDLISILLNGSEYLYLYYHWVPTVFSNAVILQGDFTKITVTGRILIWKLWFVGKIKLIATWISSTSLHWWLLRLIIKSLDKTGIYVWWGQWNLHWCKNRAGCHQCQVNVCRDVVTSSSNCGQVMTVLHTLLSVCRKLLSFNASKE